MDLPPELSAIVLHTARPLARGAFAGTCRAALQLVKGLVAEDALFLDRWELAAGLAGMPPDCLTKGLATWQPQTSSSLSTTSQLIVSEARRNVYVSLNAAGELCNYECAQLDGLYDAYRSLYETGAVPVAEDGLMELEPRVDDDRPLIGSWGSAFVIGRRRKSHPLSFSEPSQIPSFAVPIVMGARDGHLLRGILVCAVHAAGFGLFREPLRSSTFDGGVHLLACAAEGSAEGSAEPSANFFSSRWLRPNCRDRGPTSLSLMDRFPHFGYHASSYRALGEEFCSQGLLLSAMPSDYMRPWPWCRLTGVGRFEVQEEADPPLMKQVATAGLPKSLYKSSPRYPLWCAAGWQFATLPSVASVNRLFQGLSARVAAEPEYTMPWPLPSTLHSLFDAVRDAEGSLLSQRLESVPERRLKALRFVPPPKPHKARSWLNKKRIKDLLKARPGVSILQPMNAGEEDQDVLVGLLQQAAEGAAPMEKAERALLAYAGFS